MRPHDSNRLNLNVAFANETFAGDAMEGSVSGGGCRPSNNAMFYGNALAISELATAVGDTVRCLYIHDIMIISF